MPREFCERHFGEDRVREDETLEPSSLLVMVDDMLPPDRTVPDAASDAPESLSGGVQPQPPAPHADHIQAVSRFSSLAANSSVIVIEIFDSHASAERARSSASLTRASAAFSRASDRV